MTLSALEIVLKIASCQIFAATFLLFSPSKDVFLELFAVNFLSIQNFVSLEGDY